MVLVMKKAVNMDDAVLPKQQELIARLLTENKVRYRPKCALQRYEVCRYSL
jgi:hypothetical protein